MIALAPLIATFVLGSVVFTTIAMNNTSDVEQKVNTVKQINLDNIAMSALDIAKESIANGGYETQSVFYIEDDKGVKKDFGYKYLKSKTLKNKTINGLNFKDIINNEDNEDNEDNDAIIDIGYSQINERIYVLIKASKNGKDIFLGATFSLTGNQDILPLAYAGSGNIVGGSMCTMGYDKVNKTVGQVLNPDFNFYLDDKFYANPTFEVPTNATNEKDLQVHAKTGVTVTGYKVIDKVYSAGNIVLQGGATVDTAVAAGNIKIDARSSAQEQVSNADYKYPDINSNFVDNNYNFTSKNIDGTTKESITCGVGACKDLQSYSSNSCVQQTNPYNSGTNKTIWDYGYNIATNVDSCLQQYGTKTYLKNNPYTNDPKKSAWNWGYDNSTSICSTKYNTSKSYDNIDLFEKQNNYINISYINDSSKIKVDSLNNKVHYNDLNDNEDNELNGFKLGLQNPESDISLFAKSFTLKNVNVEQKRGYDWGIDNPNGNCDTISLDNNTNNIQIDNFDTTNGWTGGNIENVANGYGNIYRGGKGNTFTKTYDFGSINQNKNVVIELDFFEIDSWDYGEKLYIYINNSKKIEKTYQYLSITGTKLSFNIGSKTYLWEREDEVHKIKFEATTNSNGKLTLSINNTLDENISNESMGIDNVKVSLKGSTDEHIKGCKEGQSVYNFIKGAQNYAKANFVMTQEIKDNIKACEEGQTSYINKEISYTANSSSDICVAGYNQKVLYNNCLNSNTSTGTCIDTNTKTLPAGNYDKLIIGNNCNLDLTGSDYSFTDVIIKNNVNMTFTNNNVEFKANNITVNNDSKFTYSGTNPNSYMIMSSNNMSMYQNSKIICADPRQCLVDTNVFNGADNATVQGSLLGRDTINLKKVNIYGNMIGENVESNNARICNILDENGNQMVGNTYFDVAAGNNLQVNKIAAIVGQALCKSYEDCITKMNNQNTN